MNGSMVIGNGLSKLSSMCLTFSSGKTKEELNVQNVVKCLGFIVKK
jgi:hypothetical protein